MGRRRLGLLFGPREAGCWEFLLFQSWGCTVVGFLLAALTHHRVVIAIARSFFQEAVLLTTFLLVVSQLFWAGQRFEWIPEGFYRLLAWVFCLDVLSLLAAALTSNPAAGQIGALVFLFLLSLLIFSVVVRVVLKLLGKA